jgi:GNAT superfamily N-acetyltransferase
MGRDRDAEALERPGVSTEEARLAIGADLAEAEAWAQLQLALPESFRTRMGIAVYHHGRAVALVTGGSAELAVNRVIGLGMLAPIGPDVIEAIVAQYSSAGVERFLVHVNPQAVTSEVDGWFLARGFVEKPGLVKLYRAAVAAFDVPLQTDVRVVEIGVEDVGTFEAIVAEPLKVPEVMRPGIRSTIGHDRWCYYLAIRDDQPIAGAVLYAGEEAGWCGMTATVESERGRGAQTALLARRIQDAAAMGCRWVVAEALVEKPDRPNPSMRNMRRLGFEVHHRRRHYMFDFSLSTPPRPAVVD